MALPVIQSRPVGPLLQMKKPYVTKPRGIPASGALRNIEPNKLLVGSRTTFPIGERNYCLAELLEKLWRAA